MRRALTWMAALLALGLMSCGEPVAETGNDDDDDVVAELLPWSWTIDLFQLRESDDTPFKDRQTVPGLRWRTDFLQQAKVSQQHPEERPDIGLEAITPNCWMDTPDLAGQAKAGVAPGDEVCPCAGKLRVTVGNRSLLELAPGNAGLYQPVAYKPAPWNAWQAGQVLVLGAEGREIPPFDITATVPAPVGIMGLLLRHGLDRGLPAISRDDDLQLSWMPRAGRLAIGFEQDLGDGEDGLTYRGLCSFSGNAGQGELPAELLKKIKPQANTRLVVYRLVESVQKAGDANVRLRLFNGQAREVVLH